MKNILFATSECVPFIKTGGLADVAGSLPKYYDRKKFDTRVLLPKYACMKEAFCRELTYISHFYMDIAGHSEYVGILTTKKDGITFYFIDNEHYFAGHSPYEGDPRWNIEKFAFFSKAVLSILPVIGFRPDLIHCNDWQTGLIPVYLDHFRFGGEYYRGIRTVMTIHNLKFQGVWDMRTVQGITGLPAYYFSIDKLADYENGNLLKGGLVYADKITTVSRTYAAEIRTPFYGEGLDGLLEARQNDLYGIVNGLDYNDYCPYKDMRIHKTFTVDTFRRNKPQNKLELQRSLGLTEDRKVMLIGIVSRLTDQKGFDLIDRVLDELCGDAIQLVVLGTGEERYENLFRHFEWKYPGKVSANIFYSEDMSHRIYASSDAFLMPSLFEPCGLSQLMSLRYGTLPIVRETGGLKDTVQPYNEYEKTGTGFSFANYNAHEMLAAIRYAQHIYYDKKKDWNHMVERAMDADFSWKQSAAAYERLYASMLNG